MIAAILVMGLLYCFSPVAFWVVFALGLLFLSSMEGAQ